MAIYCNTLKGNTQYGIDPYCYIPNVRTYVRMYACTVHTSYNLNVTRVCRPQNPHLQISSASSDLKQEFRLTETAAHAYINCPSLFSGKDDAKEK